ncbi:MAG: GNAT family N-acetyltransferase, partial [Paracoccaceae bacterium]
RPAATSRHGVWTIRRADGGGKRVSAATADTTVSDAQIDNASAAMKDLGQSALFMIREQDTALDRLLAARSFRVLDRVTLFACPIQRLTATPPARMSAFAIWPPLQIIREIWADGGIGAGRIAVMQRVVCARTSLLARNAGRPAGAAFVAVHRNIGMIHAVEVRQNHRRQGVAINIMRAAAHWAQDQGARYFSVLVTDANAAANALYMNLGLSVVGHYHYRTA